MVGVLHEWAGGPAIGASGAPKAWAAPLEREVVLGQRLSGLVGSCPRAGCCPSFNKIMNTTLTSVRQLLISTEGAPSIMLMTTDRMLNVLLSSSRDAGLDHADQTGIWTEL